MKAILCLIAATALAAAETVTLTPSQDGDVYSFLDMPTSTTDTLNVGASEGEQHSFRSLVQFDLATLGIPAAEIGTAKLRLFADSPAPGYSEAGFGNVSVCRQASAWAAATLRWNHIQPQEQVALMPVTETQAWVEVDVTALVQQWVAGSVANHGLVLMPESETSGLSIVFYSMEFPTAPFDIRPQLVVTRAEAPPVLSISMDNGQVVLEWPSAASGWVLQTAESLDGPWTGEATQPAVANGISQITRSPLPGGREFFRLAKP